MQLGLRSLMRLFFFDHYPTTGVTPEEGREIHEFGPSGVQVVRATKRGEQTNGEGMFARFELTTEDAYFLSKILAVRFRRAVARFR